MEFTKGDIQVLRRDVLTKIDELEDERCYGCTIDHSMTKCECEASVKIRILGRALLGGSEFGEKG